MNDLLQRLATALATQRAFIADAAHTLRTPLTAVHLQTQMVARATEDAERQQTVAALQRGVERATHLVHQLLTLARLEPEAAQQPSHGCQRASALCAPADTGAPKSVTPTTITAQRVVDEMRVMACLSINI